MLGRLWESAWFVCMGNGVTKVPPWAFAGFICCCWEAGAAVAAEP